jgi:hypothetical protein
MKKIITGVLTLTSLSVFAGDFTDVHLVSAMDSLSDAQHMKVNARRLAAERDGCATLGYVYGRASVNDTLLKNGKSLIETLEPALIYCNQKRLTSSSGELAREAKSANLKDAIKALSDGYSNL